MYKFVSWNVNGIRAVEKKGFCEQALKFGADILAIQEVRAQEDQISEAVTNLPDFTSFWFPAQRKGYSGVGVYTKIQPKNVIYGMDSPEHDVEGRTITLEFDDFYLVNSYFPNAGNKLVRLDYKISFNHVFHEFANKLSAEKAVVMCGDFNVAHKAIDLTNPGSNEKNPGYSPQERAWMDDFVDSGYIDTFRMFNQEPDNYSWWSYRFNARARNIGWRIDYFCVDENSRNRVKNASILKDEMGSDHCPVCLDFE